MITAEVKSVGVQYYQRIDKCYCAKLTDWVQTRTSKLDFLEKKAALDSMSGKKTLTVKHN